MPLTDKKIAVLGAGNMGRAFLKGLVKSSALALDHLVATSVEEEHRQRAEQETGVRVLADNRAALDGADVVLLCVKPQALLEVVGETRGMFHEGMTVISILAGVTTRRLEHLLGAEVPVVRAMPNIPAMVDCAATAVCAGRHASREHLAIAEAVFGLVGEVVEVKEHLMDAVTGLSGSGPAYIYMVIEALADGGVKMGLPRSTAMRLATQTVLGAAQLVKETGMHPAMLRDQVTTPGGTTMWAIHDLERNGLRAMLASAVVTATERSRELNEMVGREEEERTREE